MGLDLRHVVEHAAQAAAAAKRRPGDAAGLAQGLDLDSISPHQSNEPQRGGQLPGVVELGRLAEIHGRAGVHQGVEMKVLLFQEHLQKEPIEPRVAVPVDESQVVARHVARKSANSTLCPFRLLRRSPFIRPRNILRLTNSILSSLASSSGLSRGVAVMVRRKLRVALYLATENTEITERCV